MTETFDIISDGALFCKCQYTEDGDIKLIGKNTSISLMDLQKKAMNPMLARKTRRKKYTRSVKETGPL